MEQEIKKRFEDRYNQFEEKNVALKKESTLYAWVRVLFFFGCVTGVVISADYASSAGILFFILLFLVGFILLLKGHLKIKAQQRFNEAMAQINHEEVMRMQGDYSAFDTGEDYLLPGHNYHIDLDVFGKHSIFQLISRTSTVFGRDLLANWLSRPAQKDTIHDRQEAGAELAEKLDYRQELQAHGRSNQDENSETKHLFRWIKEDNVILNQKIYSILVYVLPVLTLGSIILATLGIIQSGIPWLFVFINIGVLGTVFNRAKDIYQKTVSSNAALKAYEAQIRLIEQEQFESAYLKGLQQKLIQEGTAASKVINKLQFILDNLHNRANMLYHLFNLVFLLDVYWLIRAERWKENTKADVEAWFRTIGEMECLSSLAAFRFANPEYAYAQIADEGFVVEGEGVGHPMIGKAKRVSNDFDFSGKGGICLITGSNMSGKSTFLRTVGVNAVLALMGAPVCAKAFHVSYLKVFTSMRTQDDLEESVSSFYAELKRLKQMLDTIDGKTPVLFMVDEVLKGTNSEDRHKGAIALIRQLNKAHAFGFVSTHDIGLGNITNELQGVKNYSFNSVIENDEIIFDYTLTKGICKSFNATKLMQKMGIEIID